MAYSMKEEKRQIRAKYKPLRRALDPAWKQAADEAIRKRVESLPSYQRAACLLCYVSLSDEIDTTVLIRHALDAGKTVCVPVSIEETHTVDFYRIRSLDELRPGTYGVLEPDPGQAEKMTDFPRPAVCVVPGLVFDREGYRLGYGKGYYDRFLQRFGGVKIGVCYQQFVLDLLPHGYFDRPVDWLISNESKIRIDRGERKGKHGQKQKV